MDPNRESYFPAIEKKYGQPMAYWFQQMSELEDDKYPARIAFLKEDHGFSQVHANALVMSVRGSKSSRKFDTVAIRWAIYIRGDGVDEPYFAGPVE